MNDNEEKTVSPKRALELVLKWWHSADAEHKREFLQGIGADRMTHDAWYVYVEEDDE